jgi:hypothetical protein
MDLKGVLAIKEAREYVRGTSVNGNPVLLLTLKSAIRPVPMAMPFEFVISMPFHAFPCRPSYYYIKITN